MDYPDDASKSVDTPDSIDIQKSTHQIQTGNVSLNVATDSPLFVPSRRSSRPGASDTQRRISALLNLANTDQTPHHLDDNPDSKRKRKSRVADLDGGSEEIRDSRKMSRSEKKRRSEATNVGLIGSNDLNEITPTAKKTLRDFFEAGGCGLKTVETEDTAAIVSGPQPHSELVTLDLNESFAPTNPPPTVDTHLSPRGSISTHLGSSHNHLKDLIPVPNDLPIDNVKEFDTPNPNHVYIKAQPPSPTNPDDDNDALTPSSKGNPANVFSFMMAKSKQKITKADEREKKKSKKPDVDPLDKVQQIDDAIDEQLEEPDIEVLKRPKRSRKKKAKKFEEEMEIETEVDHQPDEILMEKEIKEVPNGYTPTAPASLELTDEELTWIQADLTKDVNKETQNISDPEEIIGINPIFWTAAQKRIILEYQVQQKSIEASRALRAEVQQRNKAYEAVYKDKAINPFFQKSYKSDFVTTTGLNGSFLHAQECFIEAAWPTADNFSVPCDAPLRHSPLLDLGVLKLRRSEQAFSISPLGDFLKDRTRSEKKLLCPGRQKFVQNVPTTSLHSFSEFFTGIQAARVLMSGELLGEFVNRLYPNVSSDSPLFRVRSHLLSNEPYPDDGSQWVDKYAPRRASEVLGNREHLPTIQKWLDEWKVDLSSSNLSAMTSKPKPVKKPKWRKSKKPSYGSDLDDFISDDSGDKSSYDDEVVMSRKHLLLAGPTASCKTSTVYALAREMGYEVFEVGPNMRRTGKDLLGALGEMAVSHLVGASWAGLGESEVPATLKETEISLKVMSEVSMQGSVGNDSPEKRKKPKKSKKMRIDDSDEDFEGTPRREPKPIKKRKTRLSDDSDHSQTKQTSTAINTTLNSTTPEDAEKKPSKKLRKQSFNIDMVWNLPEVKFENDGSVKRNGMDSPRIVASPTIKKLTLKLTPPRPSAHDRAPEQVNASMPIFSTSAKPKQSLIFLEEVDVLYEQDKGFWASVLALMQKTRRPIVMTSADYVFNTSNKTLPPGFAMDDSAITTLYFERCSITDIVNYLHLILMCEQILVDPCDLARLVHLCDRDLRKCIMMLQLWCRGFDDSADVIRLDEKGFVQTHGMGELVAREFSYVKLDFGVMFDLTDRGSGDKHAEKSFGHHFGDLKDWLLGLDVNDGAGFLENVISAIETRAQTQGPLTDGETISALSIISDSASALSFSDAFLNLLPHRRSEIFDNEAFWSTEDDIITYSTLYQDLSLNTPHDGFVQGAIPHLEDEREYAICFEEVLRRVEAWRFAKFMGNGGVDEVATATPTELLRNVVSFKGRNFMETIQDQSNIYFWNTTGLLAEFLPACIMISRDKGTLFTDYKAFMSSLLKVEDHRFALAQSARSDLSGRRRSARRGKQPRRHYHGLTEEQAVMIKEEYNERPKWSVSEHTALIQNLDDKMKRLGIQAHVVERKS